jgi:hypothetical protein
MMQGCVPHANDHSEHEGASSKCNEPYRAGASDGRCCTVRMRMGFGRGTRGLLASADVGHATPRGAPAGGRKEGPSLDAATQTGRTI